MKVYLGEYDIEQEHFPLVLRGKTTPQSILNYVISTKIATGGGKTITNTKPFPRKFRASLDQALPNLPMTEVPIKPHEAEKYVKSKNVKAGYRRVNAIIKFKILGTYTDDDKSKYSALVTDILYEF
jgi:hypothetical protein